MSYHRIVCLQTNGSIGATYENVIHCDNPDGSLSNAQIGAEIATNFAANIRAFQSWFLGWQYLYISDVAHPEQGSFVYPMNNAAGIAQQGYVYPTLCYKLKWQTTGTGRHRGGRFFIAGGRADWMTSGGITQSAATNGQVFLNNILNRFKQGGTGPIRLGTITQDQEGFTFNALLTGSFWNYLGQQRRRNYGVGI